MILPLTVVVKIKNDMYEEMISMKKWYVWGPWKSNWETVPNSVSCYDHFLWPVEVYFFFKYHTTSLGVLQSMASWRVQHDLTTEQQQQPHPLYVESKKKWYTWAYLQNRKRFTDLEDEFMVAGGREGILIVREFAKVMYPLLYSKWIPSTRTYFIAQGTRLDGMWQLGWVGVWGEWIHTHVQLSPFTVHLKPSQRC